MSEETTVIEGTEEVVTEPVETEEVVVDGATESDESLIASFTSLVGGLPEGSEVIMEDGKPSLSMKINGVPTTRNLEEIVRTYSKDTAADMKLDGVKAQEKKLKDLEEKTKIFVDDILADPRKYNEYRRLAGIPESADAEYAQELLEKAVARSEMTEEQLELENLRSEKAKWEANQKKEAELKTTTEYNAEVSRLQEKYSTDIITALKEKGYTEGSEQTRLDIMQNALYYMMVAKHNDIDVTPDQAVSHAEKDLKEYVYTMFGKMSDDQIRKVVPENVAKAVRVGSDETAGLEAIPTSNSLKPSTESQPEKKKKEEGLNEFFKNL